MRLGNAGILGDFLGVYGILAVEEKENGNLVGGHLESVRLRLGKARLELAFGHVVHPGENTTVELDLVVLGKLHT